MKLLDGAIPAAVTPEEFRRAVHILDDDSDQDLAIAMYLAAAQEVVETGTRRPLGRRRVEFHLMANAYSLWWFPIAPVYEIEAVEYQDENGDWTPVETAHLSNGFDEPMLSLDPSEAKCGLRVRAVVGHEFSTTEPTLKQAIILLAKEWFEAGIAIDKSEPPKLSFGVDRLIRQKRYRRPQEGFCDGA